MKDWVKKKIGRMGACSDAIILKAIETTEAWANGDASITLDDVSYAAYAAYSATNAAAHAAYSATNAAAYAEAYAAYLEANAAYTAAHAAILSKCADIVREYYRTAPVKQAVKRSKEDS